VRNPAAIPAMAPARVVRFQNREQRITGVKAEARPDQAKRTNHGPLSPSTPSYGGWGVGASVGTLADVEDTLVHSFLALVNSVTGEVAASFCRTPRRCP
jgi:hypothetical protein